MKSIINGNVFYKGKMHKNKVIVYDDKIRHIYSQDEYDHTYEVEEGRSMVGDVIDAAGALVVPGFIDVHIHGYKGADTMDGSEESLQTISEGIASNGVTSFLATTMTMSKEKITAALDTVSETMGKEKGARILGVHLEGPYISERFKGAQPKEHIIPPERVLLEEYKDLLKIVTIAPEVEGAMEIIQDYSRQTNFSIGHSGATFEEAKEAIGYGACGVTHLFNAMTGLHHRHPGVVGAALSTECYSEIIADKYHINPGLFELLLKAKGLDKLLLITDCMRAGGLEEGNYDLGGQKVTVKDGQCQLESGTIAGSVLKLNDAVFNIMEGSQHELEELLPLVTINQATYLGLEDEIGTIDLGKWADIVIMDPDLKIKQTIVKGKTVYESQL